MDIIARAQAIPVRMTGHRRSKPRLAFENRSYRVEIRKRGALGVIMKVPVSGRVLSIKRKMGENDGPSMI